MREEQTLEQQEPPSTADIAAGTAQEHPGGPQSMQTEPASFHNDAHDTTAASPLPAQAETPADVVEATDITDPQPRALSSYKRNAQQRP